MPQYQYATEGCQGEIAGACAALCDLCLERLTNRILGHRATYRHCADCGAVLPATGICGCDPTANLAKQA